MQYNHYKNNYVHLLNMTLKTIFLRNNARRMSLFDVVFLGILHIAINFEQMLANRRKIQEKSYNL